jgi:hypothetical protein
MDAKLSPISSAWHALRGAVPYRHVEGVAMPERSSSAVVVNGDGRLALLATARAATSEEEFRGAVWRIPQRSPGEQGWTQSGDWQSLGTPADGLPWASTKIVLARNSDERLEAAVIAGDDGAIWHAWQTEPGKGWSEWRSLGLPELRIGPPSTPAMMVNEDGRLELFTLADGAVWHRWQQQAARGPWHDWHSLGRPPGVTGSTTIAPTVARNVDGRLELFLALEGEVWHIWQTRVNNGWSDWSPLENPGATPGRLAVARDREGRLVLVATTDDGGLSHRSQQAASQGPWTPWTPLEAPADAKVIESIALRRQSDGRLVLLAFHPTGGDDHALWLVEQTDPDLDWTGRSLGQQPLRALAVAGGIPEVTSPVLALDGVGQLLLVFRIPGTTDLYWLRQDRPDGTQWLEGFERHTPPTGSP